MKFGVKLVWTVRKTLQKDSLDFVNFSILYECLNSRRESEKPLKETND